jgi:hypothetical protein
MASRTRVPERAPSRNLVGPAPLALRSCGMTGFAFGDLNGNGVWDKTRGAWACRLDDLRRPERQRLA